MKSEFMRNLRLTIETKFNTRHSDIVKAKKVIQTCGLLIVWRELDNFIQTFYLYIHYPTK